MPAPSTLPPAFDVHVGLAEQGKIHLLSGEHGPALVYLREAMRLASSPGTPEVFSRHYLECLIEALERMGSWPEVLTYCDKAIAFYATRKPQSVDQARLMLTDLAHIHQRRGLVLFRSNRPAEAALALRQAQELAGRVPVELPLTHTLLLWLERRMVVDERRLEAELQRCRYHAVRPDTLRPELATPLPAQQLAMLAAPGAPPR
jgi:hypothetical protein